jgi:hypothetical protein
MWRFIFPFVLSLNEWHKMEWIHLASVCKLFQHELLYCIPRRKIRVEQIQDLPRSYAPIVTNLLIRQPFTLSFLNLFTHLKELTLYLRNNVDLLPECLPFVTKCTFYHAASLPNLRQWTSLRKLTLLYSVTIHVLDPLKLPPTLQKVHQTPWEMRISISLASQILSQWGQQVPKVSLSGVIFDHPIIGTCVITLILTNNHFEWRSFTQSRPVMKTDILPWLVHHHPCELTTLNLRGILLKNTDLQLLVAMPNLKHLELREAKLTSLAYLPFFDSLRVLDFASNMIDKGGLEQGMRVIDNMKKSMHFFRLTGCPCMKDEEVFQWYIGLMMELKTKNH